MKKLTHTRHGLLQRQPSSKPSKLVGISFVSLFVVVGMSLLLISLAAGVVASAALSSGILGGSAVLVANSAASGGHAVKFSSGGTVSPTPVPTKVPTPQPTSAPVGFGGGSSMVLGMNVNGMTADTSTDFLGAGKYMRVDLKSWGLNASSFAAAGSGLKVDDLLQGPYNTSGIAALGNATTWANNALGWYKSDGCNPTLCPIIEVLNEPGGHWFWGNNALTESNAAAYDNLLIATYNAFKTAYGTSRPVVLASFDGGMSDGSGGWGGYMWQANSSIGNYMDGITVHPYAMQSTGLGSQSNVINSYAQAKSLSGRSIPMYITEVGWQTSPVSADGGDPPQPGTVLLTTTQQCNNIYNFSSWARGLGYVYAIMYFDYRDDNAGLADGTYGLEYGDGSHKPSYAALAAAGNGSANPCP